MRMRRINCCYVPCNKSSSRPRDQCGSVRSFTIGADQTRWFLGARDACFRESSPNDVVDGGMSSRSSHRPSACQHMMSTLVGDFSTLASRPEVWLGQEGRRTHSTRSPCHGRSAIYCRVSIAQAWGPSLSEANLYDIPTFCAYTCQAIPLRQGWSPRARRLMQQTQNRLKLATSITV